LGRIKAKTIAKGVAFHTHPDFNQLLAQANLALDLAQMRYKLGLRSIVELSQAQSSPAGNVSLRERSGRSRFRKSIDVMSRGKWLQGFT